MNRVIKFRARNRVTGEIINNIEIINGIDEMRSDYDELDFYQYTGLRDENNVEIYEGDIVSLLIDGELFNTEIAFTVDRDFNGWEITPQSIEDGAVIIGKTYENPELIK